ncbi:ATP-binding protein [uncultured Litoreibacter sp.]|uniref:ATP-binding protein n=1 Tax=uncultured Litoreibacter sp. TaxID=1392394 RepID=UPI0026292D5A|nr:ATP-binding protein [uncultured Litoreibacter sp.]
MEHSRANEDLMLERRARLAAERLLDQKQAELTAANRKLSAHALNLSGQIVDQRRVVEELEGQNTRVVKDLVAANHKVVAVERLLWDAIDTIHDGFALFDASRNLIAANPPYLAAFEGAGDVGPGTNFSEILDLCIDEGIVDLRDQGADDWYEMMLARWSNSKIEPITLRFWNGIYVKMVDRRTSDGGVVSLVLNITDSILKEGELRDARDKAQAADRAKSAFLAKMSHELRTPMNGVVGMADLLLESPLDEEGTLYAQTIRNSGEALLEIINDVLDFSKIEAEKILLKPAPFDLERLVQDVGLIVDPTVTQKGLDFQIDYDQFLPAEFVGDAGRIRQVLTNLVGNAVKFTDEGYVLVRVVGVVNDAEQNCQLHITVEDSGLGIDEDMIEHIFGEFNQIEDEANRKYEGTGLGLSISHKLVEQMGGEVWISSVKGEGACFGFKITLPLVAEADMGSAVLPAGIHRALVIEPNAMDLDILTRQMEFLGLTFAALPNVDAATKDIDPDIVFVGLQRELGDGGGAIETLRSLFGDTPIVAMTTPAIPVKLPSGIATLSKPFKREDLFSSITEAASFAPKAPELRQLRLLAAEDNKTNQLVFRKMLKTLTLDLTLVENGIEAVHAFKNGEFDMVFTDISMPEMDGMEASARIREIEEERGANPIPIIAMTAHAMDGDEERIKQSGIGHYLTKPLKKDQIHAMIKELSPEDTDPFQE